MKQIINRTVAAAVAVAVMSVSAAGVSASRRSGSLRAANLETNRVGETLHVSVDLVLDSLRLPGNRSLIVTPVVEGRDHDGSNVVVMMPSVLINGRSMHYAYERGSVSPRVFGNYQFQTELQRHNGRPQAYTYAASLPVERWMMGSDATVTLIYDSCGCGRDAARTIGEPQRLRLMPEMLLARITPPVREMPVQIHEGKARVQFEVDKTVLHAEPYRCRSGQLIDNRSQLALIEDTVKYALSDPNVEIARVEVCGYASPESPYTHNDYLATNRSRALSEWIADRFNLPAGVATYSAVPENWAEFRIQVLEATDITEQQRADLLELIDEPVYGPTDYDAKERRLKTDPKFSKLYRTKILPEWFPHLRATKFAVSTRLRPMDDRKLAEVIRQTPELLSLNQMMRVARLYDEGTDEFNEIIEIALRYYPDDPDANLNAAVTALLTDDTERAERLLERAGNSPEAENARGVLCVKRDDFETARIHFEHASAIPEARQNLEALR